ncbi:YidB family protein [Candidatus Aalborgicola defluviihabitans]|uniref:YidB family protein n=1 Tax=Candidatus Aalborgicola defluviihabitans TaxID=3386187 RepID=UPI001DB5451B|nr:DUF937 domain-containing protein [Burkholderiales bacterium]
MGLFDSVMGAMSGQLQQHGGLTQVLGGLLANNSELGGLNGLTEKFNQAGLGNVISSWIGKGQNMPISADQIASVLGSGTLGNIASQLGMDPAQASQQLSHILPGLIDHLTPHGTAPEGGLGHTTDLMGMLGSLMQAR